MRLNRMGSKPSSINPSQGFTLVEIMVVVLIIAVLAAVVAPDFFANAEKAQAAKAKSDLRSVKSALDIYRMDNFQYPTTAEGLEALVSKPASAGDGYKPSLDKIPKDPWGREYKYRNPSTKSNKGIDVYSTGKDGQPNTADDIGTWDL